MVAHFRKAARPAGEKPIRPPKSPPKPMAGCSKCGVWPAAFGEPDGSWLCHDCWLESPGYQERLMERQREAAGDVDDE